MEKICSRKRAITDSKTERETLDETEKAFHWEMERDVCIICQFQKKCKLLWKLLK